MRPRLVLPLFLASLLWAGGAWAGKITVLDQKTESRDQSTDREEKDEKGHLDINIHVPTEKELDSLRDEAGRIRIELDELAGGRREGRRTKEIVSFGRKVEVGADQIVEGDVVCMLGSVEVNGVVQGSVVALGGDVRVGEHAIIHGDAVSIGGSGVHLSSGSVITGEAVAIGGRVQDSPGSRYGDRVELKFIPSFGREGMGARGWVLLALLCLHLVFIGLIGFVLLKLAPHRWGIGGATLKARSGESLLAGFGAGIVWAIVGLPVMLVVMIALIALVVGIPLVPLVAFLMFIVPLPGYIITALLIGDALQGRDGPAAEGEPRRGQGRAYLVGHVLLTVPWLLMLPISVIPGLNRLFLLLLLLGWGIITLAVAFGWGAFLLSRFGTRPPTIEGMVTPPTESQEIVPAS